MAGRIDPYRGYNFAVELDGITRAGFRECSGLDSTQNSVDYREGTDKNLALRKVPGLNSYSDITLSRGFTDDRALWDWRHKAATGAVERRTISIIMVNDAGAPLIRWNLFECWPKTWTGPSLNAQSDEVAVEQLTLTCERIEVDAWQKSS